MMNKKSLDSLTEAELKGKKVLVRVDLNVPLDYKRKIIDDSRIHDALPTIDYLRRHGARVILASHLGCPEGQELDYSMRQLVPTLSAVLRVQVKMAKNCVGEEVKELADSLQEGEVLLLENLRFFDEDEAYGDPNFASKLGSLADLFVNDSFVTSHKIHASTERITDILKPAVAGLLMQKELKCLSGVLEHPKEPFAAIVGGSTLSEKADLIMSLLNKVNILLLGGAIVFNFFLAEKVSVGSSLLEDVSGVKIANSIIKKAKEKGVKLSLPIDVVVANKFGATANHKVVESTNISDDEMGLDIGPRTIGSFYKDLNEAKTIIWTGPMGVFEYDQFSEGTKATAEKLAELTQKMGVETIIFGGETVAAVRKMGLVKKMSFVSSGRGATLTLLEGKELHGVTALDDA